MALMYVNLLHFFPPCSVSDDCAFSLVFHFLILCIIPCFIHLFCVHCLLKSHFTTSIFVCKLSLHMTFIPLVPLLQNCSNYTLFNLFSSLDLTHFLSFHIPLNITSQTPSACSLYFRSVCIFMLCISLFLTWNCWHPSFQSVISIWNNYNILFVILTTE